MTLAHECISLKTYQRKIEEEEKNRRLKLEERKRKEEEKLEKQRLKVLVNTQIKWSPSPRWSFGPNSVWGCIETTIRKTHPTL